MASIKSARARGVSAPLRQFLLVYRSLAIFAHRPLAFIKVTLVGRTTDNVWQSHRATNPSSTGSRQDLGRFRAAFLSLFHDVARQVRMCGENSGAFKFCPCCSWWVRAVFLKTNARFSGMTHRQRVVRSHGWQQQFLLILVYKLKDHRNIKY